MSSPGQCVRTRTLGNDRGPRPPTAPRAHVNTNERHGERSVITHQPGRRRPARAGRKSTGTGPLRFVRVEFRCDAESRARRALRVQSEGRLCGAGGRERSASTGWEREVWSWTLTLLIHEYMVVVVVEEIEERHPLACNAYELSCEHAQCARRSSSLQSENIALRQYTWLDDLGVPDATPTSTTKEQPN
ncbi:hypothetical protein BKA93DRAFT_748200 [Sparassis latifolia]